MSRWKPRVKFVVESARTQWFGVAVWARAVRPRKGSSVRTHHCASCFPSSNYGPRETTAAFTSQDPAASVCVSGVKRCVAGEGPRVTRCSGIRWVRLAEAALASTTRPRSGDPSTGRRAYNHSTPDHPSGYALEGGGFSGGWPNTRYAKSEWRGESCLLIPSDTVMRAESHPPPRRYLHDPSSSALLGWKRICTERELAPEHRDNTRKSYVNGSGVWRDSSFGACFIQCDIW